MKEFLAGEGLAYDIFVIALAVLELVFFWKIFEKAGEKGWKALIPGYNIYIFFKLVWNKNMFWLFIIPFVILIGLSYLVPVNPSQTVGFVGTLAVIGCIVWIFIIYINLLSKLCRAFGKGGLFLLGLLFIDLVFLGILAFDKSKYERKN